MTHYYYSYNGELPAELPSRFRLDDGSTKTSLDTLTIEELNDLGFTGPFTEPEYDSNTHRIKWDGTQYQIIGLNLEEIENKISENLSDKIKYIDYNQFWSRFLGTKAYKKIKAESMQTLEANTIFTELTSIFSMAAIGFVEVNKIDHIFRILALCFKFTVEEIDELKNVMCDSLMDLRYTLFYDNEYIESHTYDAITDKILES